MIPQDGKLLPWSERKLIKEVKRTAPVTKRYFNTKTRPDAEFDTTMKGLSDKVIKQMKSNIREEFNAREVDLSSQNIRGVAAEAVGECLKKSPCVTLNLSGNYIRDSDLALIAVNLHHKTNRLQNLNLANNRIGIEGAKSLAQVLGWNKSLLKVNIDTNNVTGSGIEFLARSLANNGSLLSFSANWNNLGLFAEEFYFTLSKNTTLQVLKLGYCGLTDTVAEALADGLKENSSLQELFLCGNNISDEGGIAILDALIDDNHTLRYINLANNLLTDASGKHFNEVMICKSNLGLDFYANLSQNSMSDAIVREHEKIRQLRNRKQTRCESAINPGHELSFSTESESHGNEGLDDENDVAFFNNKFYTLYNPNSHFEDDEVAEQNTPKENVPESNELNGFDDDEDSVLVVDDTE